MEFHDVANIFPMMSDEEFQALVADVKIHGQIEPIVTYQGKIVDGRNRYKACLEAGIKPHIAEWGGQEANLLPFVLSLNLQRRHLTSGQKAILAIEIEKYLAVEAEKRMLAGKKADPVQKFAQGKASEQAAHLVGTNRQYVLDAKKVMEKAPEIGEAVKRGDLSISDAKYLTRQPTRYLQAYQAIAGEIKDGTIPKGKLKQAYREVAQKEAEEAQQKREAERAAPGYQERVQQAEKERRASYDEWNKRWKEREAAHTARVKAQLNAPGKADIRAALYTAAKEADMQLARGLQSYLKFLMHFGALIEGVILAEDTFNEPPQEGHGHEPRDWPLYTENGRSQWLKTFVGQEYDGCYEKMLAQVMHDKRIYNATDVPYIKLVELQRWIDDPSRDDENSE